MSQKCVSVVLRGGSGFIRGWRAAHARNAEFLGAALFLPMSMLQIPITQPGIQENRWMSEVRMSCKNFLELTGLLEQYMPRSAPFGEGSKCYSHVQNMPCICFVVVL